MAADHSFLSGSFDQVRQVPDSWQAERAPSSEGRQLVDRMLGLPPSESSERLSALIEMVKADLQQQWQQGRQVGLESYLEILPELGSPDTIPTELVLAEYEARRRSGAPAEWIDYEGRFPRQAEELRRRIDLSRGSTIDLPSRDHPDPSSTGSGHSPLSMGQPTVTPIKVSKQFGRYRILRRLGRGAMGSVYLAHDAQLDRRVALKVPHFRSEGAGNEPNCLDLDRFYREAQVAATFDHPNLCPVYDVGQINGIHYLTMAFLKGRPLSDYIDPHKLMPPRRVATTVRKLALALEVAHTRGIVHRDLKPSNIMVGARREPVIMDFGLAWRIGGRDERLTRTGSVLGTPAYMSPEQLSGKPEVLGPRCDIYSLGVIMYELLTACRPFEGPEAVVLGQILFIEPAPPSGHRPDLDPLIEAICLKAMAKRPEDRYATMGELAADLGDYLRGGTSPHRSSSAVRLIETSEEDGTDAREDDGQVQAIESPGPGGAPGGGPEPARPGEPSGTAADPATLEKSWRQWTAIVEQFALRRSRRHVDWQVYHRLHQEVIEACRARAAVVDEAKRAYYRNLENLVLPWLTPKALAQADREILFSLLLFCRQAEQELGGRHAGPPSSSGQSSSHTSWVQVAALFLVVTLLAWLVSMIWSAA